MTPSRQTSPFVPGDVHTFDTSADVDWVSLTFDETQVGKPYTLKTVDAGLAARVAFTVYGPDQTTVVDFGHVCLTTKTPVFLSRLLPPAPIISKWRRKIRRKPPEDADRIMR